MVLMMIEFALQTFRQLTSGNAGKRRGPHEVRRDCHRRIVLLIMLFFRCPFSYRCCPRPWFTSCWAIHPRQLFAQRICPGWRATAAGDSVLGVRGVFMNFSGVTAASWSLQRHHGAMSAAAQVNVLLSTLMGGLSGSNLADAAMEAKMLVPEMEKHGFSRSFSTVITAMSSMITPLIPPGIALILYGSIATVSIGKLFIAGIGPGLLLCVTLMVLNVIISKKRGYKPLRTERIKARELGHATKVALLPRCFPSSSSADSQRYIHRRRPARSPSSMRCCSGSVRE
jgi:hypothetical protein